MKTISGRCELPLITLGRIESLVTTATQGKSFVTILLFLQQMLGGVWRYFMIPFINGVSNFVLHVFVRIVKETPDSAGCMMGIGQYGTRLAIEEWGGERRKNR